MFTERFSIVIDYILDTGEQRALHLTPEDYFELDDTSKLSVDSTPKHQEVRQYFPDGTPLKQARVRVVDTVSNDMWEVNESYWKQFGDEGKCVTVRELRNGTDVGWKKFISIRFSDGGERVMVLVQGDNFPLLDGYVVIENDTFQGSIELERSELFRCADVGNKP